MTPTEFEKLLEQYRDSCADDYCGPGYSLHEVEVRLRTAMRDAYVKLEQENERLKAALKKSVIHCFMSLYWCMECKSSARLSSDIDHAPDCVVRGL